MSVDAHNNWVVTVTGDELQLLLGPTRFVDYLHEKLDEAEKQKCNAITFRLIGRAAGLVENFQALKFSVGGWIVRDVGGETGWLEVSRLCRSSSSEKAQ